MRKSKKNITKRNNKTIKNKCVITDEVKRLRTIITHYKTQRTTKKNKTS